MGSCPDVKGIIEEVSMLRQTVMDMNIMIQKQKQNQDKQLVNLMQRISDYLPNEASPEEVFKATAEEEN